MKEAKDLTIANYAGHTNFFFEHDAGTPNALKGGNVKVEKAEAGSHATMITEHTGVTSSNLTNVLKALAKKLYYTDSADSRNLSGTVKVLEGLTASSAQMIRRSRTSQRRLPILLPIRYMQATVYARSMAATSLRRTGHRSQRTASLPPS